MRNAIRACLLSAMLVLPAYALTGTDQKSASGMHCPMMAGSGDMQKGMNGMMTEMRAVMDNINDPALKTRMQKMHDQMGAMMVNMQKMSGCMIGAMMQGKPKAADPAPAAPAIPTAAEDHEAHHPAH